MSEKARTVKKFKDELARKALLNPHKLSFTVRKLLDQNVDACTKKKLYLFLLCIFTRFDRSVTLHSAVTLSRSGKDWPFLFTPELPTRVATVQQSNTAPRLWTGYDNGALWVS